METIQAIRTRRAVRSYSPTPPSKEQIEELIDAAICAPSDINRQPWSFLVVHGSERVAELEQAVRAEWIELSERPSPSSDAQAFAAGEVRSLIESGFPMFHGASAVIVCMAPQGDEMATIDTSLAAQNLMLAAHASGLATCPVALTHHYFDLPETKSKLKIPANLRVVLSIVVGVPTATESSIAKREEPTIFWR